MNKPKEAEVTLEEQEDLAVRYVHSIGRGGLDHAFFAADLTAWTAISGTISRDQYLPALNLIKAMFTRPLVITVDNITSVSGRSIVQCRGQGVLFNGAAYSNTYLMVVEFDNAGKIRHVREYMDTVRARDVLMPAYQAWITQHEK